MDEPTAWEDINPPMVSVQPLEQRSLSSARPETEARLTFRNELTACLALVAPVGMTEEAKRDWLTVAWQTLSHIPPDILSIGCTAARRTCDHPSKIVPAIIEETREMMRWRMDSRRSSEHLSLPAPSKGHVMDRRGQPMTEEDTKNLNDILENLGAVARYKPDGSRWFIDGREDPRKATV